MNIMANKPKSKIVKNTAINRKYMAISLENNELYIEERRAFIDKFTVCDVTCKAYIENYKKLKKTNDDGSEIKLVLDMRIIPKALEIFDVHIERHILTNVFGAGKKKGYRSCKKIRDGIVHAMKQSELEELHERYVDLMNYMDAFLIHFIDKKYENGNLENQN